METLALKGHDNGLRIHSHDLFRPFRANVFWEPSPRAALFGCRRVALPWADLWLPLRGELPPWLSSIPHVPFVEFDFMPLEQQPQLILKRHPTVMRFLILDVSFDVIDT